MLGKVSLLPHPAVSWLPLLRSLFGLASGTGKSIPPSFPFPSFHPAVNARQQESNNVVFPAWMSISSYLTCKSLSIRACPVPSPSSGLPAGGWRRGTDPFWGSSSLLGSLWQGHGNIWDLSGRGESSHACRWGREVTRWGECQRQPSPLASLSGPLFASPPRAPAPAVLKQSEITSNFPGAQEKIESFICARRGEQHIRETVNS